MRRGIFLVALVLVAFSMLGTVIVTASEPESHAASDGLSRALLEVETDVAAARDALLRQREVIAAERAELSAALDARQAEARRLREAVGMAEKAAEQALDEAASEERDNRSSEAACAALLTMLSEFRRTVETHMSVAELQRDAPLLEVIDAALADDEAGRSNLSSLEPALDLVRRLIRSTPATAFEGHVFDQAGRALAGQLVSVGPMTYFVGEQTEVSGVVVFDVDGIEARLLEGPAKRYQRALHALTAEQTAAVPVDVTGGAALRLTRSRVSVRERLLQGGWVMVPLLAIGVLCLTIAVLRAVALRRMVIDIEPALGRIIASLRAGRHNEALADAGSLRFPWGEMLRDGVMHWRSDRVYLEEVLRDRIQLLTPRISARLGVLAISAAAAPLLGLLGTVTGMIRTFQLIAVFGAGDARSLSGGISEALITTQFGLVVAVPALLTHAWLSRRAGVIAGELEQAAVRFVREAEEESRGAS